MLNFPESHLLHSWPLLFEQMECLSLSPEDWDELLANGWRHFGKDFFRSSIMEETTQLKRQVALRVEVDEFFRTKSQRRVWRKNEDLEVALAPALPGEEEEALFLKHSQRFSRNVPESLSVFLGAKPDGVPCPCTQVSVRQGGDLVAASFLACGAEGCSSIYGIFDPELSSRSLGVFTMLVELSYAREKGLRFYYSGYATLEPSCYDYKKAFSALSYFDWKGKWIPYQG